MSKIRSYIDEAYQLPVDTIYFIDSKQYHKVFEIVAEHARLIEMAINSNMRNRLYDYKIQVVSYAPDNTDFLALFPSGKPQTENKKSFFSILKSLFNTSDPNYNLAAHIVPGSWSESEPIRLLTETVESQDIGKLTKAIIEFANELNCLNIQTIKQGNYPIIEEEIVEEETIDYCESDESECSKIDDNETSTIFNTVIRGVLLDSTYNYLPQYKIDEPRRTVRLNKGVPSLDPELYELAERIKRDIDTLQRSNGINILMEKLNGLYILQPLDSIKTTLSPIVIDDKFRILLPEYDCEIECPILSKAVYILFLRHSEGIRLKEISDYADELRKIYFTISPRSNMLAQNQSINTLTDPTSGSLNQKISRISAAFRNKLNSQLVLPYIISGERGGLRKIELSTEMISLPSELAFLT